jgi:hypothetical protein
MKKFSLLKISPLWLGLVGAMCAAALILAPPAGRAVSHNELEGYFGQTPTKNPFFAPPATIAGTVIDWTAGEAQKKTLAANTTFTMTGMQDGQRVEIYLTNTASNYTVAYTNPSGFTILWPGGSAPTETVGAKTDKIIFRVVGTVIYGQSVQNY